MLEQVTGVEVNTSIGEVLEEVLVSLELLLEQFGRFLDSIWSEPLVIVAVRVVRLFVHIEVDARILELLLLELFD